MSDDDARVVVLTKSGCHLCEDACRVVAEVTAEVGERWREQRIDADAQLLARWAEYVPVIVVDGEVHDWFRVRPERLRSALS